MSIEESQRQAIVDYYDKCEANYRRWWDLDQSLAMHAGYWDATTKTLTDALRKENEILANLVGITSKDRVLDAGCGVGGSSIYLAQTIKCPVVAITLSEKQARLATLKAKDRHLTHPPTFLVKDYTHTGFPDHSFDVVWAIESVCHAKDKRDFIKEAWRLLSPGGRLILADGFHVRNIYSVKERQLLGKAVNGWAVDTMESIPNFEGYLKNQGFSQIGIKDITPHVLPSSRRLFYYSFPAVCFSKLGEYLGWSTSTQTKDFLSYHYQYWAVKKQLCKYIIFSAVKP